MQRAEFEIYVKFYEEKLYHLIPIGEYANGDYFYMTSKQVRTLELLNDDVTTHIGYGGSARSGKSIIECCAIIFECEMYPGIAWGLGRKELTTLKKTVLITLTKQLRFYGFTPVKRDVSNNTEYNHKETANTITFFNTSIIYLIDTKYYPSDPLNTKFGGFELTRCAIDESNETNIKVVNKLFERTGWCKNDIHDIKRKLFECFNPDKNHVHRRYYKPFRDKVEPEYKKFIPALPSDNPHPAVKEWIDDIKRTGDKITIERQINGNFDYDDDPSSLVDYEAIMDIFTNEHVQPGNRNYITADLAMQGRDRFIAMNWKGLVGYIGIDQPKSTGKSIEMDLKQLKIDNRVGNSNIIADSDGLGGYLESYIKNIKTFHGNGKARNKKEFLNIKDECGFKLAELINKREIRIICKPDLIDTIAEEIAASLKRDNLYVDVSKKKLISKKEVKENIQRSPDYFDNLLMRMFPEIRPIRMIM